jgi:hypothetical protein
MLKVGIPRPIAGDLAGLVERRSLKQTASICRGFGGVW